MKISLVCSTRDNLQYLKWSYESVRKNQGSHEVWMCYGVDHCTDGTLEWIQEIQKKDPRVKYIVNETGQRLGHTIMYDKIVYELVETDLAMIWHSDMYLCEGALDSIESLIQPNTIVSLTRIEPPLHPSGPEKIVMDFGTEPDNFNEAALIEFVKKQPKKQPTKGVFAPWAFWVNEFKSIGGHDFLFSPQSKEDCVKYDTLIFVEIGGYKQYITVNELWDRFAQNATIRNDGNCVLDLKSNAVYVLSPDSKTDGEFGLQRLNGLVRKVVDSRRMFDVRTNWGIVTVTDDHSLLDCENQPTKVSNLNENCRLWKPKTIKRDRIRRKLLKSLNINGLQIDNIDEFGNPKHLIDICEFLGFFVAEGSITNKNYAISICQNNLETLDYMKNLSIKLFGADFWGNVITDMSNGDGIKPVYIYRKVNSNWGSYLMELVGKNSEYKKVPDFIFNLPKIYQEAFLYGYLVGDGYLGTSFTRNNIMQSLSVDKRLFFKTNVFKSFQWKSTSKSSILTAGINLLLRRCFPETLTNINFVAEKGSKGVYNLSTLNTDYKEQILQITPHDTNEPTTVVFDLEVKNTHCFIGGIGLVGLHNSDIFNRFKLSGVDFKQTWEGFVYHLTCRGSRYNPNLTTIGQNSSEWEMQNIRSARNFIRKWGSMVQHTAELEPIIPNKYNIGFVVYNPTYQILYSLEPFCDVITLVGDNKDVTNAIIKRYIYAEQPNTKYDLSLRVRDKIGKLLDIIVTLDANIINPSDMNYLMNLPVIIADSGEIGEFQLGNLQLNIGRLDTYQAELVNVSNPNININLKTFKI